MPRRRYPLKKGERKRVAVSWSTFSSPYLTVRLDRNVIGTIRTKANAELGQTFPLEDGSMLHVQFVDGKVHMLRDGQPLPGSPTDPFRILRSTSRLIFGLGGFNIVLGSLFILLSLELGAMPLTVWAVIMAGIGLTYVVLGFFVRQRSQDASAFTLVLFTLNALLLIPGNVLTLILYIAIFRQLIQGFRAIKAIDDHL